MTDQIHLRIKNPETKKKLDNICKEKNISFNQLANEIFDDYASDNDNKTSLKNIEDNISFIKESLREEFGIQRRNTLVNGRCMTFLILENSKNILEMKEKGIDYKKYYSEMIPESLKLLEGNNPFYKELLDFIENYKPKF